MGTLPWVFDMPYMIEIFTRILVAYRTKKRNLGWLEWQDIRHIVFPMDMDYMDHMNNARYNRKFEYARTVYWIDSGLYEAFQKLKVTGGFKSIVARFRREVRPGVKFKIRTRLTGWDERSMYMEHHMVTEHAGKKFVNSYAISKYTMRRSCSVKPVEVIRVMYPEQFAGDNSLPDVRLPEMVREFAAFEEASSNHLLKEAKTSN
eukprot:CAMPEP_0114499668 /NCGR_PEP_ID=MMETSP0109-20121206/7546_1 /TAXON_ID=29199 /ORGANISM="Chlorarachnion reptans, Strain CCCM449" /LENGTH=203 /DNA_ID=CAMNT_0001677263 /DNA_START=215 /DNA_END=826 /DNA_ORIENTATION=+